MTPLSPQIRADVFTHLAAMEKAGLPPDKSLTLLRLPVQGLIRVAEMRRLMLRGLSLPQAGCRAGLFTELDGHVLQAAFEAGSPLQSYQRLAHRYALAARSASQMRSRMMMPLLVLCLALMVQPLPALVSGTLTGAAYLWQIIRPLLLLTILWLLWRELLRRLDQHPSNLLSRISVAIPWFGPVLVKRNVRDFYENLALLLEAGLAMQQALPLATQTVNLGFLRADFQQCQRAVQAGAPLSHTLSGMEHASQVQAFIHTGEASGTLPEMLGRYADGESATIAEWQKNMADWLPRLFYALVVGWMAYQMLQQRIL